jgi:hypothetical protein
MILATSVEAGGVFACISQIQQSTGFHGQGSHYPIVKVHNCLCGGTWRVCPPARTLNSSNQVHQVPEAYYVVDGRNKVSFNQ